MITIFILSWIFSLSTFVVGFYLGKGSLTKQTYTEIKKELEHKILPHYTQKSGLIDRPTAQRLNEIQNPKTQEEIDAMRGALEQGIQPLTR